MSNSHVDEINKEDLSDDVKNYLNLLKKTKSLREFIKNPGDASQEEIEDAKSSYRHFNRLRNEVYRSLPEKPRPVRIFIPSRDPEA